MAKIIANTSLEVEADYDDSSSFIRIRLKIKKNMHDTEVALYP